MSLCVCYVMLQIFLVTTGQQFFVLCIKLLLISLLFIRPKVPNPKMCVLSYMIKSGSKSAHFEWLDPANFLLEKGRKSVVDYHVHEIIDQSTNCYVNIHVGTSSQVSYLSDQTKRIVGSSNLENLKFQCHLQRKHHQLRIIYHIIVVII